MQLCHTINFAKSLASGCQITYQISAQSVQPFPRSGKWGTFACDTCTRADISHPRPVYYASRFGLQTHTKFCHHKPIHSLVIKRPILTPPHFARATVATQMDWWFHSQQKECGYPPKENRQTDIWLLRYKPHKSVTAAGRPVAHTDFSLLF